MIGVYDRTVILTFLSLMSAVCGCIISCAGVGHPYLGGFFLLFCGFCDSLDGRVARRKKGRSEREKAFGAHIDSLTDVVAFGVLPAAIAFGLIEQDGFSLFSFIGGEATSIPITILFVAIVLFYSLAALIRLAYFNALDEERRHGEVVGPAYFVGMPVTMAALIFPLILLLNFYTPQDFSLVYSAFMVVVGILFLINVRFKKPGAKVTYGLVAIGAVEFVLMIIALLAH